MADKELEFPVYSDPKRIDRIPVTPIERDPAPAPQTHQTYVSVNGHAVPATPAQAARWINQRRG